MATTETTETTETLRVAIETALRRRDPEAEVCVGAAPAGFHGRDAMAMTAHGIARVRGDDEASALRTLARLVGLRDDGSDPAAEVERLTRALHDVAERLGCADYDDVCAAVADALDDAEAQEREHVNEANTLRMERDRLTRERDEARAGVNELAAQQQRLMAMIGEQTAEKVRLLTDLADARAALRAHLHCDECDELATRTHAATASFCCDAHAVGEGWSDTTHAAAVRAAMEGGR